MNLLRRTLAMIGSLFLALPFHGTLKTNGAELGQETPTVPATSVGMTGKIEQLVLPGSELEAIRSDDRRVPVVLRIANVSPHVSAFRYDLVYYGLEPGKYDLAEYLRRKDGSSTAGLPKIEIEVQPTLPPGQIEPQPLSSAAAPPLGGYRAFLKLAFALWFAGLLILLLVGRKFRFGKRHDVDRAPSFAERLRPLVEDAMRGNLSTVELAELERTLIAYWRRRLGLQNLQGVQLFGELRRHDEAGPLLEQLEAWLHQPSSSQAVDVSSLLRPYRDLPAGEFDFALNQGGAK
ncbi:MAG: hypothetical protein U1D30_09630 [Planctomycetota bacterium]